MATPITDLADRTVLTEYEFGDETLEQALHAAFERIGVDTMEQTAPFQAVVDMDALNSLHDGSASTPLSTLFVLYGHPVSVTSDRILVYETATRRGETPR